MNKKPLLLLPLLALSLTACVDTAETYEHAEFTTGDFISNRYSHWDKGLKEAVPATASYNLKNERNGYFSGVATANREDRFSNPKSNFGLGQAKEWHPDYFRHNGKELLWTIDGDSYASAGIPMNDIAANNVGEWADNSSLVGTVYGQTKKMSLINDKFSRGVLSKLYNGQIKCDGWGFYSLVLLDQSGYGTIFPATMQKGSYFAFSARGGSDASTGGRVVNFDITVTFYKKDAKHDLFATSFFLDDVTLETDAGAEYPSLTGFDFNELGYDPTGIMGMSMTYSIDNSPDLETGQTYTPEAASSDFTDGADSHVGLCLLEVFFPDSSWE